MDSRLTSILLLITFLFQLITEGAAAICPRYKCDSSQAECSIMLDDATYGKNVTLKGCVNSTSQCLVSEASIVASPVSFNVSCTEKDVPKLFRFISN